jgi:diguanylate cyclase (GGDEF)-like protein/PAS domain S-box-containing protein
MTFLKRWFAPPRFADDPEKTALAHTINTIGMFYFAALLISAVVYVPFLAVHKISSLAVILGLIGFHALSRGLLLRGHLSAAGVLQILSLWLVCEGLAFLSGGMSSPAMFALSSISIAVGLLIHPGAGTLYLVITCLTQLIFAILQQNGVSLPVYFGYTPLATWFYFTLSLLFMYAAMRLTVRKLQQALRQARKENAVRKQMETTLRESEEKHRLLHESLRDGYAMVDLSGKVIESNETYRQMLRYTSEELSRLTYFNLTPEKWHAFEEHIVKNQILPHGDSQVYEKEYIRKDGTTFPVELRVFTLNNQNGDVQTMWAIVRDITERKQAETALHSSKRVTLAILNAIPDLMFEVDGEGRFTNFHAPMHEKLYATPAEFMGKKVTEVLPEPAAGIIMNAVSLAGELGWHRGATYSLNFPDRTRWFDLSIEAKSLEQGPGQRFITLARDITAQMEAAAALQEQHALSEALRDSSVALSSTLNFQEVLDRVLENVGRVVPHEAANIMLLKPDGNSLTFVRSRGYSPHFPESFHNLHPTLAMFPILKQAAQQGSPLVIADTLTNPNWLEVAHMSWVKSMITVPILVRQQAAGFLNLDSATPGFFTETHAERLAAFAGQMAIAFENARLYEEVKKLAVTDQLTGCFNRTFFEAGLDRMEHGREFPVSIIVADLDNMKMTNDLLGHAAGDELLKQTVVELQEVFRAEDVIARIGGDEFAVLLPQTDAAAVEQALTRVNERLSAKKFAPARHVDSIIAGLRHRRTRPAGRSIYSCGPAYVRRQICPETEVAFLQRTTRGAWMKTRKKEG